MSNSDTQQIISKEACEQIDVWIAKYPVEQKQSAVMAALTIVQDENGGWLTNALMDAVADYLDMPKIAVYEVASFYSMYELSPVGRHKIGVCNSVSCMLKDSAGVMNHLKKRLDVEVGGTSADGKFTLKEVECLGACAFAPVFHLDKTYHENLTPKKIDDILAEVE